MSDLQIANCPSTLLAGHKTYSHKALISLFSRKKLNHVLPHFAPHQNTEDDEAYLANRKRISISGVQEKLSYTQHKNVLELTKEGEQGTHLLKSIPRDLKNVDMLPANEHLTMQIAHQVFGINTAANGLIFFKGGEPAYITKRFDVLHNGMKLAKEDFASLGGKTSEISGSNYKYSGSYYDIAQLIQRFCAAAPVQLERFFSLVVFNYLFSNGDAHLKNFALLETANGDFALSPAYDLLCTELHVDDGFFALEDGLYEGDLAHPSFSRLGYYAYDDFYVFGQKINLNEKRIKHLLLPFTEHEAAVFELVSRSFLTPEMQKKYLAAYQNRLKMIRTSLSEKI